MKYSTKLSDAVHILVYIALRKDSNLSSTAIAESVKTNPAFVRQIMTKLRKADIIKTVVGHAKPELARAEDKITLFDVYKAVEGNKPLLHLDTHTNPECGVGVNIQKTLQDYYDDIQKEIEEKMSKVTLKDIIESFHKKVDLKN